MSVNFHFYQFRDWANLSCFRHTKFEGFIVTMHQSGTHWLKHMLATAISRELKLPPPKYAYAGDMIGGTKDPKLYPGIPSFGHSHTIPTPLIRSKLIRLILKFPRYVILVRDIRDMLISHYEKHNKDYNCKFSEFLKGDVTSKRFYSDIWWCIRFQNAWGRVFDQYPDEFIIIKYEDMIKDTLSQLKRINSFLRLNLSDESMTFSIHESTKEKMRDKPIKPKEKIKKNNISVRTGSKSRDEYFAGEDYEMLKEICNRYLKYNFGYKY